jgi:HSP20 family protein
MKSLPFSAKEKVMTKQSNGKDKKLPSQPEGQQQKGAMDRPATPTPGYRGNSPLTRLRTEFDRLFDDFFRGWGGLPAWPAERSGGWGLDIDDQDDKIVVRAEAPGFEPDDFDLQVRDDQLMLCACQSEEKQENGGRRWHQQELYRSVPLPHGIDAEHIDAQYRNGILTVTLPKTEKSKSRRIDVKS